LKHARTDDQELFASSVEIWTDPEACFPTFKGRVALYLVLRALGVEPGDEVVVPGFTCVVVPAAIKYTGATPVYYDIDLQTLQGDPELAEAAITPRTKAVLVQHNFGAVAPMGPLAETCSARGIALIEDCAHSMGAMTSGRPAGRLGTASFCSLQWSKPTTTGLGGIARFNDITLAARAREIVTDEFSEPTYWKSLYLDMLSSLYRRWFKPSWYWTAQGLYRLAGRHGLIQGSSDAGELQDAAMPPDYCERFGARRQRSLDEALSTLPAMLGHRRRVHGLYAQALAGLSSMLPPAEPEGDLHVGLRFPLLVENRDEILTAAKQARIELGDWFNDPLHPKGADRFVFDYADGCCPNAEFAAARIINLPTHRHVSPPEVKRIVEFAKRHAVWTTSQE